MEINKPPVGTLPITLLASSTFVSYVKEVSSMLGKGIFILFVCMGNGNHHLDVAVGCKSFTSPCRFSSS